MRLIVWNLIGTLAILGMCLGVLVYAIPARAAQCRGTIGLTSYYSLETCRGKARCLTASGHDFTGEEMTAASRSLPFGTRVRVTRGDRSVVVTIDDRGPALRTGRILDLSRLAAERLGILKIGVAKICLERLR